LLSWKRILAVKRWCIAEFVHGLHDPDNHIRLFAYGGGTAAFLLFRHLAQD
jgi:hypothetical protein